VSDMWGFSWSLLICISSVNLWYTGLRTTAASCARGERCEPRRDPCRVLPLVGGSICASILWLRFVFPRNGSGIRYGASVSTIIRSRGIGILQLPQLIVGFKCSRSAKGYNIKLRRAHSFAKSNVLEKQWIMVRSGGHQLRPILPACRHPHRDYDHVSGLSRLFRPDQYARRKGRAVPLSGQCFGSALIQ